MKFKALILALTLAVSGCAALSGISDYVNENPLIADIAVSQGTGRYIEAQPDTSEAAKDVVRVVDNVLIFVDKNPQALVSEVFDVISANINWDNMSISDKSLVQLLVAEVEKKLIARVDSGEIGSDELIGVRSVLETAKRTASLYVT